jgi:hypothetical protein
MSRSAIPLWPTASSIGSFTTPIASRCGATPCAKIGGSQIHSFRNASNPGGTGKHCATGRRLISAPTSKLNPAAMRAQRRTLGLPGRVFLW